MDTPEKELLTPEETDEDFESIYAEIFDEFGGKNETETEAQPEELPGKPAEPDNAYADKQKQASPVKKDHSIRNLTILIIIELLGIAGVAAWWILRLL